MTRTAVTSRSRTPTKLDFRPDLQWLRAVAVLLVFAYHLDLPGFAGGYVGVDVFFVLSGYLITRLLLHELARTSRIDLVNFALRRVRRLLPVSAVVLGATLVAMWATYGTLRRAGEAVVARWTAVYGANIGLALQETDYLTAGQESPLQHYWSLAVEEQFYLLWPTLLFVIALAARMRRRDERTAIRAVLIVAGLASLGLAWHWTSANQPLAFFLLPARAWQLIAGALLAVAELQGRRPRNRSALRVVGILLLVGMSVAGTVVAFPWPLAIVPVVATAAIVWAGVRDEARPGWLEHPAMVWIGDRSYALYLWHWPPLVLLGLTEEAWTSRPLVRLAVVVAVFMATVLTYRLVEEPLRHGQHLRTAASGFGFAAAVTGASLALAVVVTAAPAAADDPATTPVASPTPSPSASSSPAPTPEPTETAVATDDLSRQAFDVPETVPDDLTPTLLEAIDEFPATYDNDCHAPFEAPAPPPTDVCTYGSDAPGAPLVALVGDSHAAQWFEGARGAAGTAGWRLVVFTKSGCSLYEVDVTSDGARPYPQCPEWREATRARLADLQPDVLLVAAGATLTTRSSPENWFEGQAAGVRLLRDATPASAVVVLLDTPLPEDDIPLCLDESSVADCTFAPDGEFDRRQRAVAAELGDATIDAPSLLCTDDSCPPIIGNVLVYRDDDHLSGAASRLLTPALVSTVQQVLE